MANKTVPCIYCLCWLYVNKLLADSYFFKVQLFNNNVKTTMTFNITFSKKITQSYVKQFYQPGIKCLC